MTTVSDALPRPGEEAASPTRAWARLVAAFVAGFLATLAVAAGALLAYAAAHDGRVLQGVHVGAVNLSGMDGPEAGAALTGAYGGLGEGQVVLHTGAGDVIIAFRDFARRPDVDAMVAEAMATGRAGSVADRALGEVRLGLDGTRLEPRLALDETALTERIAAALEDLELDPVDAMIALTADGVARTPSRPGRRFEAPPVQAAALEAVRALGAPALVELEVPTVTLHPRRDNAAVLEVERAVERMITDVPVTHDGRTWTIPKETVAGWMSLEEAGDGTIRPVVDPAAIAPALVGVEKAVRTRPVAATFLTGRSGAIVGVKAGRKGARLDTAATAAGVAAELSLRAGGLRPGPVTAVVATVEPELTTAEAERIAPRMKRLGKWRTWFPIGERNAWGANIWLPARFINGTVLYPGQKLEWWRAVGPITRERGFGMGGVIKGDHTEPMGAIGGGMCSSSTTLFNAALRAGLKVGARSNHRYYINRYPLGLDATVSGSQTMSFTNDMATPILIRGYKSVGRDGRGWVHYEIWGVDDGRTVSIGKARVSNVIRPGSRTVEVSSLPTGRRRQIEWPMQGMDVSVTRVVRDRNGNVLHRNVLRSHYTVWDAVFEVGR